MRSRPRQHRLIAAAPLHMPAEPTVSPLPGRRSPPPAIPLRLRATFRAPLLLICRSVRLRRLDSRWQEKGRSQGLYGAAIELAADLFGKDVSFDFQRCRAREIFGPEHVTADAFVGRESLIAQLQ